ncbi:MULTISPECIES: GlxA family transcriptional regulator [Mesorhizobium]|uniref:GlxA family transcriptional regulator n=1 Tax=Mesorhizobium TaxID=68287 RepID=UPI001FE98973|nr:MULTISPECIES: GlxA family transcriptional regulator [Mesorhizobium]
MQAVARTFSFYLLPTFSLQAFSSAVEVLRLANEVVGRNVYDWQVISSDGQPVVSSSRLVVNADIALRFERERNQRPNPTSAAIVCGGSTFPGSNLQLDAWLRECRNRRTSLVGIGSGSIVLARAGLAEGRRCAIHWEQFPLFLERFPTVAATQTAFEQDGDLSTCSGGDAPFDMFLRFVERDHGAVVVNRICGKAIACRTRSAGERQRLPFHSRVRLNHKAVIKVIDQMEANVDNPMQVDALVASTGMSRRQIERLFASELGRSPSRYYLALRLERAHLLLISSRLSVLEIAIACGFATASHFTKVYREAYGSNPNQTRLLSRGHEQNRPIGSAQPTPMATQLIQRHARHAE